MSTLVVCWKRILGAFGYRVNWEIFYKNRSQTRSRRRSSAKLAAAGFQTLEPRKLLAAVHIGSSDFVVDAYENEIVDSVLIFRGIESSDDYSLRIDSGDGSQPVVVDALATVTNELQRESADGSGDLVDYMSIEQPWQLHFADDGEYEVSVELIDGQDEVVRQHFVTVFVEDVVAEITQLQGLGQEFLGQSYTFGDGEFSSTPLFEGQASPFSVTLQDVSPNDTLTATLKLGDGSAPARQSNWSRHRQPGMQKVRPQHLLRWLQFLSPMTGCTHRC